MDFSSVFKVEIPGTRFSRIIFLSETAEIVAETDLATIAANWPYISVLRALLLLRVAESSLSSSLLRPPPIHNTLSFG